MLFRRRTPADWRETLRVALWPRRNWTRSGKYVAKRVFRLTGSPHGIAAGIAAGVFASFTPYLGFHFVIAFTIAYVIAGNFIAAAMGTFFGNPFSFPFIWASTYATGKFILSGATGETGDSNVERFGELAQADFLTHGFWGFAEKIAGIWEPVILPMTVGAVPLGVTVAIAAYLVTRTLAVVFRDHRRKVLAEKAIAFKEAVKRSRQKRAENKRSTAKAPKAGVTSQDASA